MTNHFATLIKQAYDKIAKTWHEQREWYIEKPALDGMLSLLKPGAKILDVGCGSGKPIAAYLQSRSFSVMSFKPLTRFNLDLLTFSIFLFR